MTPTLFWRWLRQLVAGRNLSADLDRNRQAAERLDAALREVLKR